MGSRRWGSIAAMFGSWLGAWTDGFDEVRRTADRDASDFAERGVGMRSSRSRRLPRGMSGGYPDEYNDGIDDQLECRWGRQDSDDQW
jgi:hypothetical protein